MDLDGERIAGADGAVVRFDPKGAFFPGDVFRREWIIRFGCFAERDLTVNLFLAVVEITIRREENGGIDVVHSILDGRFVRKG